MLDIYWFGFFLENGTNREMNQAFRNLGIGQLSFSIDVARRFYRLTTVYDIKLEKIDSIPLLLPEFTNALEQAQSRQKRKKYLRIFLYATEAIVFIFAMLKLAGIHLTGQFSKNQHLP